MRHKIERSIEEQIDSAKTQSEEKPQEKVESKTTASGNQKSIDSSNYLYDRFVVTPTNDDPKTCVDKISDAFLTPKDEKSIKDNSC